MPSNEFSIDASLIFDVLSLFCLASYFDEDKAVPIYEYQCECCGHKLEVIQKISEDPLKTCPECREESLGKLISAAAFRLKGGGWYETDFKDKKARKNLATGDDAGSTKADTTTEKKPSSESNGSAGETASKADGNKAKGSAAKRSTVGS